MSWQTAVLWYLGMQVAMSLLVLPRKARLGGEALVLLALISFVEVALFVWGLTL